MTGCSLVECSHRWLLVLWIAVGIFNFSGTIFEAWRVALTILYNWILCSTTVTWSWTCSFGFRFFANKARLSRGVVSHAQKIERIRDQRVVQTKWHDPREKTSTIPIHILHSSFRPKATLNSPPTTKLSSVPPSKLPTTIKTTHSSLFERKTPLNP